MNHPLPEAEAASRPLAFLHTGEGHVKTFQDLVEKAAPGTPTRHVVAQDLLDAAVAAGGVTATIRRAACNRLLALADDGAGVVLCTCSTIGEAAVLADQLTDVRVLRVDRPMAEKAVTESLKGRGRIAVAVCVPTTVASTVGLVEAAARDMGATVTTVIHLLDHAWPAFEAGDLDTYHQQVAEGLRAAASDADAIVIGQASMAPAVALCPDITVPMLTSPALGVDAALAAMRVIRWRDGRSEAPTGD